MRRQAAHIGTAVLLCAATLLLAARPGAAVTFPEKPSHDHYYVDEAGLISEAEGREIDGIAAALLREEKIPILVVTIRSLMSHGAGGYTVERYAAELFDEWGIGSEDRNYGMLLLVSSEDRKARIEFGAGWAHRHDVEAQQVMDTLIVPEFRQGRYAEGVLAGVRGMNAMARGLALPKPTQPWWVLPAFLVFLAVSIGVIVSLFKSGHKGWGWALIVALGALLFFLLRAAAQSRGSGGSFGGGSSGGGGASGSW